MTEDGTCSAWCCLPAGHVPVHDVLPIPLQEHAASPWVRGAYEAALGRTTPEEATT